MSEAIKHYCFYVKIALKSHWCNQLSVSSGSCKCNTDPTMYISGAWCNFMMKSLNNDFALNLLLHFCCNVYENYLAETGLGD